MVTRAACHSETTGWLARTAGAAAANPAEHPVEPFAGQFTPKG